MNCHHLAAKRLVTSIHLSSCESDYENMVDKGKFSEQIRIQSGRRAMDEILQLRLCHSTCVEFMKMILYIYRISWLCVPRSTVLPNEWRCDIFNLLVISQMNCRHDPLPLRYWSQSKAMCSAHVLKTLLCKEIVTWLYRYCKFPLLGQSYSCCEYLNYFLLIKLTDEKTFF